MKIRIAIPGYERILQLISTIRSNSSSDVEFAVVPPDAFTGNGGEKIRAVEQAGDVDIFVASGSAYACFEQYVERTPVVQVRPSGFDLLCAINEIPADCSKVAVLMSRERIAQMPVVKNTVRLHVADYVYQDLPGLSALLSQLYNEGYEHIIGNTQAIERSALLGMTGHYIWSTKSYLDALDVAIKIVTNQRTQQLYAQQVSLILQNIHEGVLVTNRAGVLMQYNESAGKILGRDLRSALGRDIGTVLPRLSLPAGALRPGGDHGGQAQDSGQREPHLQRAVVPRPCDHVPEHAGAFQSQRKNQKHRGQGLFRQDPFFRHGRPESRVFASGGYLQALRRQGVHHPALRRDRHRKGSAGPKHPQRQRQKKRPLCGGQLRGHAGRPAGK